MTFRELFFKVSPREEMRVYEPNRDCLVWETFRKIHAPYNLYKDKDNQIMWDVSAGNEYFDKNETIASFRTIEEIDEQTELFIEKYGDYEVHGIECSGYTSGDFNDPDSSIESYSCLDVFICVPDPEHERECERCHHSKTIDDDTVYRGWSCVPDKDDAECKKCWRNK